jgi:hypothetical protein
MEAGVEGRQIARDDAGTFRADWILSFPFDINLPQPILPIFFHFMPPGGVSAPSKSSSRVTREIGSVFEFSGLLCNERRTA